MGLTIEDYKTKLSHSNGMSDYLHDLLVVGFKGAEKYLYPIVNNEMLFRIFTDIGFDDLHIVKLSNGWIWSVEIDSGKIPSFVSMTWLYNSKEVVLTARVRDYAKGRDIEKSQKYPLSYLVDKNWNSSDVTNAAIIVFRKLAKQVWGL